MMTRRRFLQWVLKGALATAATGAGGVGYTLWIEPRWLMVERVTVPLAPLPPALHGFTIAQLSDLHSGPTVPQNDIAQAVELALRQEADLVVLTGDFVYRSASYSASCAQELASLQARCGVYAVLGNHDIWTDADHVAGSLAEAGIVVLRDERQALEAGNTRIWLLGIEDTGYTGGFFSDFRVMWQKAGDSLAALLEGIPPDEPRLLLVHNPDFTEMLPEGRIDLALCGHTHGGQVRLPLAGAPLVPSCFGRKYAGGLVQGPSTLVYVNRGVGLISPPVRFNCRPEVTLLTLVSPTLPAPPPARPPACWAPRPGRPSPPPATPRL